MSKQGYIFKQHKLYGLKNIDYISYTPYIDYDDVLLCLRNKCNYIKAYTVLPDTVFKEIYIDEPFDNDVTPHTAFAFEYDGYLEPQYRVSVQRSPTHVDRYKYRDLILVEVCADVSLDTFEFPDGLNRVQAWKFLYDYLREVNPKFLNNLMSNVHELFDFSVSDISLNYFKDDSISFYVRVSLNKWLRVLYNCGIESVWDTNTKEDNRLRESDADYFCFDGRNNKVSRITKYIEEQYICDDESWDLAIQDSAEGCDIPLEVFTSIKSKLNLISYPPEYCIITDSQLPTYDVYLDCSQVLNIDLKLLWKIRRFVIRDYIRSWSTANILYSRVNVKNKSITIRLQLSERVYNKTFKQS